MKKKRKKKPTFPLTNPMLLINKTKLTLFKKYKILIYKIKSYI